MALPIPAVGHRQQRVTIDHSTPIPELSGGDASRDSPSRGAALLGLNLGLLGHLQGVVDFNPHPCSRDRRSQTLWWLLTY
jgi:hypothetical protein